MQIVQCSIENGLESQIVWLDNDRRLKEGVLVTLKDSEDSQQMWEVVSIGGVVKEKSDIAGKRSEHWFGNDFHRKDGSWQNC